MSLLALRSVSDVQNRLSAMTRLAVSALILWLLHAAQTDAACREDARLVAESPKGNCELTEYLVDRDEQFQKCLLARPVEQAEMEQARESVRASNCFLETVLRPEVTDAIRRGAESYLAMPRLERRSLEANGLRQALDSQFKASWNPNESENVLGLLDLFIDRAYRFEGWVANPKSGLEKIAHRQGIYSQNMKESWVLFEYAAFLTGSRTVSSEARRWLEAFDRKSAPPENYSAKGCKKKISYDWPTMSRPLGVNTDLPADAPGYGPRLHVGICPDDQSLWVYHFLVDWRKVSAGDVTAVCNGLFFAFEYDQSPVAMACKRLE